MSCEKARRVACMEGFALTHGDRDDLLAANSRDFQELILAGYEQPAERLLRSEGLGACKEGQSRPSGVRRKFSHSREENRLFQAVNTYKRKPWVSKRLRRLRNILAAWSLYTCPKTPLQQTWPAIVLTLDCTVKVASPSIKGRGQAYSVAKASDCNVV